MHRTSLLCHYFLNEGFVCSANDLVHQKKCDLHVSTVHPNQYGCCGPAIEPEECWPPGAKKFKPESCDPNTHFDLGSVLEHHEAWILDVDLDFFSTGNPFKKSFTKVESILSFVLLCINLTLCLHLKSLANLVPKRMLDKYLG